MKKLLSCLVSIALIAGIAAFFFVNITSSQSNRANTGWNTNAAPIRYNYNVNGSVNTRPYVYSNVNMAAANIRIRPRGLTESEQLIQQLTYDEDNVRSLIGEESFGGDVVWSSDNLQKGFTIKRVDLNGDRVQEYVIWATHPTGMCGASGNCAVWVYRKKSSGFEQMLEADTTAMLNPAKTKTNGYSDLLLGSVSGAHITYFNTYKFDGREYRSVSCYVKSYLSDSGAILKRPRIKSCD